MIVRCLTMALAGWLALACQPEAVVQLDCPTEPGQRVQVALLRRVAYSIEGDCPERDDCVPSRELWSYSPIGTEGDIRFYERGLIRESITYGYRTFDPFCCPTQGAFVVGITPGTVKLFVEVAMAVDGRVGTYTDSCELPIVVWDVERVP